jgi:predicted RNA binding protein YcfA (HicA-like mRNA interferase family)
MIALPSPTGRELVAALGRAGFEVLRIKGSHHFLRHADGRTTVIPVHGSETIGPGLLAKILRDCDIARDEFANLLKG